MRTLLGHAAAGADPFWLLIGAAGGLHHTLALVASGVAVGGPARPVAMAWSALRFTGCMAIGLLAAGVSSPHDATSALAALAAMTLGLALAFRRRIPVWVLPGTVTIYWVLNGFLQYAHLAIDSQDGPVVWAALSTVIATTGSFGIGLFVAWATEVVSTGWGRAVFGGGTAMVAGLVLLLS